MNSGLEIERRFLVTDRSVVGGVEGVEVVQAYIFGDEHTVLRVGRRQGEWRLTIKDRGADLVRREFRCTLPPELGAALFTSKHVRRSIKRRHEILFADHIWLVDVHPEGPILAEVELGTEDEVLSVPAWCGTEVTGDPAFSDYELARFEYEQLGVHVPTIDWGW